MKFKIDENLPVEVADLLRQAGHDAATVLEEQLGGRPDRDVATICQQEQRALMTLDLDFGDIRAYPPERFAGLIVLHLKWQDKPHVLAVARRLLQAVSVEALRAKLWIVDETHIRIRE